MKTRFIATAAIVSTLILSAGDVLAARKNSTVQGVLKTEANGRTILQGSGDKVYYFDPDSEAGKKILSVCESGKMCVVRGVISGSNILNAYFVKLEK